MTAIEKFNDSFQPLIYNIVSLFEANSKSILDFEPIKANILERNKGASGKLKLTTEEVNFFMQQTIDLQGHIQTFGEYFTANQVRLAEVYNALKELDDVLKSNNEKISELTQQNSGLQESLDQIKAKAFAASSELDAQAAQKSNDKAQIASLTLKNKNLEEIVDKNKLLTERNDKLTQDQTNLLEQIERKKELVKKYEEESAICEEERARLKTLSESIGTYIDGVDDHLTGQSARQSHSVDTGAFRFTAKSPELPAEKQGSPGRGGKRRKRTLRKKIIRRR